MKWTEDRRAEYQTLRDLIIECTSINSDNNITNRLQKIIALSKSLNRDNCRIPKRSFLGFLEDLIKEDKMMKQ